MLCGLHARTNRPPSLPQRLRKSQRLPVVPVARTQAYVNELVIETLYSDDERDYLVYRWKPLLSEVSS